jgi:hypothetical protein
VVETPVLAPKKIRKINRLIRLSTGVNRIFVVVF